MMMIQYYIMYIKIYIRNWNESSHGFQKFEVKALAGIPIDQEDSKTADITDYDVANFTISSTNLTITSLEDIARSADLKGEVEGWNSIDGLKRFGITTLINESKASGPLFQETKATDFQQFHLCFYVRIRSFRSEDNTVPRKLLTLENNDKYLEFCEYASPKNCLM